jgi:hypothetical protein
MIARAAEHDNCGYYRDYGDARVLSRAKIFDLRRGESIYNLYTQKYSHTLAPNEHIVGFMGNKCKLPASWVIKVGSLSHILCTLRLTISCHVSGEKGMSILFSIIYNPMDLNLCLPCQWWI